MQSMGRPPRRVPHRRAGAALVLVLALALLAAPARAQAPLAELSEVAVIERDAAVEVWVRLSRPAKYQSELIDGPWRLVIDFDQTAYRWTTRPVPAPVEPVRELRGSQYRPGVARLVIELRRKSTYAIEQDREGLRIVLPREGAGAPATGSAPRVPPGSAAATPPPARPEAPAPKNSAAAASGPARAEPAPPRPPAVKPEPASSGPRVHGIIMLDQQAHAYIFDPGTKQVRRYAVGDALGDGVVETIGERHVVLKTPGGRVELRVEETKPTPLPPPAPRPR
jgi:hypothetical protein